ncbi:hypothetical protein B0H10DRAFT_338787 [Mycena sp. CBHHK59/15]|nr:hypothetical protein B0H10DRAFT_338787 [Mycena sp. CBHHK59/15]
MNPNPMLVVPPPIWNSFRRRVANELSNKARQLKNQNVENWLPPGFPTAAFELLQLVDWWEGGFTHYFQYKVSHQDRVGNYGAAIWVAHGKARIKNMPMYQIGCVEIDGRLYADDEPLKEYLTDGQVALSLLRDSIASGHSFRVASVVTAQPMSMTHNVERIVAHSSLVNGSSLQPIEFVTREIPKRICTVPGCGVWLPLAGPNACLHHIPEKINS